MDIGMKEVRQEIDLIDRELVLLLARRQKCIEMAALVKNDKNLIIDEERIEEVIEKVTSFSQSCGLSKEICEPEQEFAATDYHTRVPRNSKI